MERNRLLIPHFLRDVLPAERIEEGPPGALATARPQSVEEIQQILRASSDAGLPLRIRGGGVLPGLAEEFTKPGIVLDTGLLNRVLDYSPQDLTLTAQAGARIEALEAVLGEKGQRFPYDAPCPSRSTLGGSLASGIAGPRRLATGLPRDWILGLKAVLPDGSLIKGGGKVVKNVAGYDLQRLFVGSRGTLGLIVEATLKTAPRPEQEAWFILRPKSHDQAWEWVETLAASDSRPSVCEWTGPENLVTLGFEGSAKSIRDSESRLARIFPGPLLEKLGALAGQEASERLRDLVSLHGFSFQLRGAVRPGRLGGVLEAAVNLCANAGLGPRFRAHALSGVFDLFLEAPGKVPEDELLQLTGKIRSFTEERGGGGYPDGSLKVMAATPSFRRRMDLWGGDKGARERMAKIQAIVDPRGILAGGKAA